MFRIFKVKKPRLSEGTKEVFLEAVVSLVLLALFLLVSFEITDFFLTSPTQAGEKMGGRKTAGESFMEIAQLVFGRLTSTSFADWRKFFASELAAIQKFLSYRDFESLFFKTQFLGGVMLAMAFLLVVGSVKSLGTSKSRDKVLSITRATLSLSFVLTVLVMSASPFFFEDFKRVFWPGKAFSFSPRGFWVEPFYPILINELVAVLALTTFLAWAVFGLVCFLTRKKT